MRKAKLVIFFGIVLFFSLLFIFKDSKAQTGDSGDAIGVRIIPNPNHYSIYRWYSSQGFKGSPQALSVDGYEAVRDGRTVYVNAANIKNKSIYTNIYLISYNQDPSEKTVDILGQIVKYWKFNNDLTERSNIGSQCTISSLPCLGDSDCSPEQICATSVVGVNSCQLKTAVNCATDNDCPQNFFCNSVKAKIIRDLKRVGLIEELKEALFAYKSEKGTYPRLAAGSYLSGYAISVWPSWTQAFLPLLTTAQNIVDPINRLGPCHGYDLITCWSKETNRFVSDPSANSLILPIGSYGFVYGTDANGSNYNLCAVMETREATPELNFEFAPNNPASSNCVTATGIISGGTTTNTPPRIIDAYLTGESDQEFNGSLNVIDDQGNPISWNFKTSGESWTGWSAAPILKITNNPNQKRIYSVKAGGPGVYNAQLTLADGQGGILSTTTPIVIVDTKPFIESDNGVYSLNPNSPFTYSFYFSDTNLANPATAYTVTKLSGPANFDLLNFTDTIVSAGSNRYKVTYQGSIPTTNKFYSDTEYSYRIAVKDKYNSVTTKDFKILIKIEPPVLAFNCPSNQRFGVPYSCFLGYTNRGDHAVSYTGSNLPTGLSINLSNTANDNGNNQIQASIFSQISHYISRLFSAVKLNVAEASTRLVSVIVPQANLIISAYLSGTPTVISDKQIAIKATNEYGASSTKVFNLSINNYCGDGQKQEPNTEGRGGIYNDGYEDCDQAAGLSVNQEGKPVVSSSSVLQYGCTTVDSATPYPIPNNNYCIYKSPVDNGGYCGDGYCQYQVIYNNETVSVENSTNCGKDCDPNCEASSACGDRTCGYDDCGVACGAGTCEAGNHCSNGTCMLDCTPQCSGRECGSNGCGGFCGTCSGGEKCNDQGQCIVSNCTPTCVGKTCGNDGCGGSCGTCNAPQECKENGVCCDADCHGCVMNLTSLNWQVCGGQCCDPNNETCCNDKCIPKNQSCVYN